MTLLFFGVFMVKLIETKDEEYKDIDKQKFLVSDGTVSYDEIKQMYPIYNKRMNNDMLLFWDDTVAYTSIGLLDFLNQNVYKKDDFNFYFKAFLERNNTYLDGLSYAVKILEEEVKIKTNETVLEKVLKDNYFKILQHSPLSGLLHQFSLSKRMLKNIYMVFRVSFKEAQGLTQSLKDILFQQSDTTIIPTFLDEEDIPTQIDKYKPNIIFGGDSGACLEYAYSKQLKNIEFFCNYGHNGISEEFLFTWANNRINYNEFGHSLFFYHDNILNNEDGRTFISDKKI